jgi:dihydroorotase
MCSAFLALMAGTANAQLPAYDLLLRGGHVIDPKNHIDGTMDVAIKDGHIAKVAPNLKPTDAIKAIDVRGLVVTPGLIDRPTHN